MLSLRLSDGLDLQTVQSEYGSAIVAVLLPAIRHFLQQGLMQVAEASSADPGGGADAAYALLCNNLTTGKHCRVRLTDPAGFLLSNNIISDLFAKLDPSLLSADM